MCILQVFGAWWLDLGLGLGLGLFCIGIGCDFEWLVSIGNGRISWFL